LPRVNDDLGLAPGAELVASSEEIVLDLLEVVDLAVVGDDDRVVLVVERLLTALEIDDREAPVAESHAGLEMEPVAVGTARRERSVHRTHERFVNGPTVPQIDDAGNSAHYEASAVTT